MTALGTGRLVPLCSRAMRGPTGTVLLSVALVAMAADRCPAARTIPPEAGGLPGRQPVAHARTSSSPTPATPEEQVEAAVRGLLRRAHPRRADERHLASCDMMTTRGVPARRAVAVIDGIRRSRRTAPDAEFDRYSIYGPRRRRRTAFAEVETAMPDYDVIESEWRRGRQIDCAQRTHVDLSLVAQASTTWIIANLIQPGGTGSMPALTRCSGPCAHGGLRLAERRAATDATRAPVRHQCAWTADDG